MYVLTYHLETLLTAQTRRAYNPLDSLLRARPDHRIFRLLLTHIEFVQAGLDLFELLLFLLAILVGQSRLAILLAFLALRLPGETCPLQGRF